MSDRKEEEINHRLQIKREMDDRLSQRQIAELKKTQGNQFFARDDLKSAISSYSEVS